MKARLLCVMALSAVAIELPAGPAWAQDTKDNPEAAAIGKSAAAFVEAFHNADAKSLAAHWTMDGDFTDQTGRNVKGHAAIEKSFTELFTHQKGLKLRINSLSLRFVSPEIAIEDGTTEVFSPDGAPPSRARFTIVHAKKDGQWRLCSVREAALPTPSNYQHLRGLDGIIGTWGAETPRGEVERISLAWSDNQNFIVASLKTTVKNVTLGSAKLTIGWDPMAKQIRSWMFDASGGFGEGIWAKDGGKWLIKTSAVLQDGKKATATYVFRPVDANSIAWQVTERSIDGNSLPDTKEITMKRLK